MSGDPRLFTIVGWYNPRPMPPLVPRSVASDLLKCRVTRMSLDQQSLPEYQISSTETSWRDIVEPSEEIKDSMNMLFRGN